jgi:hypothetical protein
VTEANAQAAGLDTAVADATTQAGAAATKAGEALTSANNAATSKADADAARDAAVIAKNAAEAALDSFDDRYLGAKAVEPTLDNDGAALLTGALYWDTALPGMRSWNGSAWVTLPAATAAAISNTPAGTIAATTVQDAINELDSEKVAKTDVIAIANGGTGATTADSAADAIGAFRRGTLLGTVSQYAGVPTGAVIERGSNANGDYVRFADGTQICTRIGAYLLFGNSSNLNADWTFPAAFVSPPSISTNLEGVALPTTKNISAITAWARTTTTANVSILSPALFVAGDQSGQYTDNTAIGRWY